MVTVSQLCTGIRAMFLISANQGKGHDVAYTTHTHGDATSQRHSLHGFDGNESQSSG